MKLKVYAEKEKKDEVVLRLFDYGNRIILAVADENGDKKFRGNILEINQDGELYLNPQIDKIFCFSLDKDGKIKLKNESGLTVSNL